MYARIERFNLAQGFAELAEGLADRIAPIMRRQPGLRTITLFSDESSGEYILLTHWDSLEQVNTYERSPEEWRVRDIMSQHLTAVPVIEVYQVHTISASATPVDAGQATTAATIAAAPPSSAQRAQEAGVAVVEPQDGQCPATHPVKGNHSRTGEFIYHLPGSHFYDRTEPEVCFATETEAQTAGFRPPHA